MREPQDFGKVAVLYGGCSLERAVSLESGRAVLAALQAAGIEAVGLDTAAVDPLSALRSGGFDRAFIALHGAEGENGTIQALLELLKIPYTGSGVAASALAMDKLRTKLVWQSLEIPTPPMGFAESFEQAMALTETLGYPLAVKPINQGSTMGISKVSTASELAVAYTKAVALGPVMLERWITGSEYTVSLLAEKTLPIIKITTASGFYDYHAKYEAETTRFECPCDLSVERHLAFSHLALRAYQAIGCTGWGRVDLVCDEQGAPWLLEVNTVPGMTSHSLVPTAARAVGLSFQDLVVRILEESVVAEIVKV